MNPKLSSTNTPIKLYGFPLSGHAHRAELLLAFLDLPYEKIDIDLLNGAQKQPDFLEKNPFGQVPVIDDNGQLISDSNAILVYLAKKYSTGHDWLPEDPVAASDVQRWLSVAANEVYHGPHVARLAHLFQMPFNHDSAVATANALFDTMDPLLNQRKFLTGDNITIADVACYTYISLAPEGAVSLQPYAGITGWLGRIEAHPGFVNMTRSEQAA